MGFWILLTMSFLLCIPACFAARKRQSWFARDYATVHRCPFGSSWRSSKLVPNLVEIPILIRGAHHSVE